MPKHYSTLPSRLRTTVRNMRIVVSLFCLFFLFSSNWVWGETANVSSEIVVVSTGIGSDADGALKNALVNAVQQSIGLALDAETMVRNDEIIKDQILTYSNGFVETFEKIKEGKRADGLFETTLKAHVKKGKIIEKLKECKITTTKVDGSSLFAETFTTAKVEKDSSEILKKILDGLPRSILIARAIGKKPRILAKDEDTAKVAWDIEVSYDKEAYYKTVAPQLKKLFDGVAVEKSDIDFATKSKGKKVEEKNLSGVYLINEAQKDISFWDGQDLKLIAKTCKDDQAVLWLNSWRNAKGDSLRWVEYIFEKKTLSELIDGVFLKTPKLRIELVDESHARIHSSEIDFTSNEVKKNPLFNYMESFPGFLLQVDRLDENRPSEKCYYPLQNRNSDYSRAFSPFFKYCFCQHFYSDSFIYPYEIELTLEEIKNIAEIKCYFVD